MTDGETTTPAAADEPRGLSAMHGKFPIWLTIVLIPIMMGSSVWVWRDALLRARRPEGIVSGNGRIESIRVDVATKYAGRVSLVLAREGDPVVPGQVVAQMNTDELQAELARARAKIAEGREIQNQIQAEVQERECRLKFAQRQFDRDQTLFDRRMISREQLEQSQSQRDVAASAVEARRAGLQANQRTIEAAEADARRVETQIAGATLTAPVQGRVLYQLAEEGEVVPAGGKVLTLVDLTDVYMEIFLPAQEAAMAAIGDDARIITDCAPGLPSRATVCFVSPEAQFTPKHVETRAERDKLMFRIKLRLARELTSSGAGRVKTGVRGVGYVKIDDAAAWPETLEDRPSRTAMLSAVLP